MSGLFRPTDRDIASETSRILAKLIKDGGYVEFADAIQEAPQNNALPIIAAIQAADMTALGLAVWSALSAYHAPQAVREAQEYADRIEAIEREKSQRTGT